MPSPEIQVFYSSGLQNHQLPFQYFISDFIAGACLLVGMFYLAQVMTVFLGGYKVRKYAYRPVTGILLYTIFHQGGELACESTLHGGVPTNLFGTIHILIFQSMGGIVFLVGSIMFYQKMRSLIKGD